MKSRQYFVKQLAETIRKNHAKSNDNESFIVGISGKWGEGKTYFLNDLNKELKNDFIIVNVNPWKFAADKTSFLRKFLRELSKKENKWTKICNIIKSFLTGQDEFYEFYFDVSKNKINYFYLAILIIVLVILFGLYKFVVPLDYKQVINEWKLLLTFIILPVFLALFARIVLVQQSSRSISTIDRFDESFKKIISRLGEKIVIFVDDLDRVTPQVAREVLDNLRTFFDTKELSFVVTGDHTVLERYIGSEILPSKDDSEQLEEGRRFLKKIFNLYWRLPLPIDNEFKEFLDSLFEQKKEELNKRFAEHYKSGLYDYLLKYFDKNFRQTVRFLETVLFTFRAVDTQIENADENNKKYFEDLLKNPLLVIRILMIQELCAPLFDQIIKNYEMLYDLEYFVEKKQTQQINEILDKYKENLSASQRGFIEKFLYEEPRFYKNSSVQVLDIRPFLYLAADASFEDLRGPSLEDFISILGSGDPSQVKNALLASGEEKIADACNGIIQLINTEIEQTEKDEERLNNMNTFLTAVLDIPETSKLHKTLANKLKEIDLTFFERIASDTRMKTAMLFWQWLDMVNDESLLDAYKTKFPFRILDDLEFFNFEKAGDFTTLLAVNWLITFYPSDKETALDKMNSVFPKLQKEIVKTQIQEISVGLVDDIMNNQNNSFRDKVYNLLKECSEDGLSKLKINILPKIKELNEDIWNWSLIKCDEESPPWTKKELEQQILSNQDEINDVATLNNYLRFCSGKVDLLLKILWDFLLNQGLELFLQLIPQIIDDAHYQPLAPDDKEAGILFQKITDSIFSKEDNEQKMQILIYLKKEKWPWLKISKILKTPKKRLIGMKNNQALKQTIDEALNSWS